MLYMFIETYSPAVFFNFSLFFGYKLSTWLSWSSEDSLIPVWLFTPRATLYSGKTPATVQSAQAETHIFLF